MTTGPARFCTLIFLAISLVPLTATGQRIGNDNRPPRSGVPPSTTPNLPSASTKPIFISGRVVMDGGASLPEPAAIERVCNGVTRREGYTDFKGQFQIQLGANLDFQDASEIDSRSINGRGTTQSGNRRQLNLANCEFRAVLSGFQSTSAAIQPNEFDFQYDVGTIVLKKMGDVSGATVSLTSLSAPQEARRAYEKARKATQERRTEEAEKQLNKAVRIYPHFAAAWFMLGNLREERHQLEQARAAYQQALSADPQYVNPWFGLALVAVAERNWEEAAKLTAQVVALNAYAFPAAYFYSAAANYNLGKLAPAEENARKYIALDTEHKHPDAALLLSRLLQQKKDYSGAAQQIRDYLEIVPLAPNAKELKARAKKLDDLSLAQKR